FDSTDLRAEGGALGTLTQSDSNPLVYTALFTPTANFSGKGNLTLLNNYADNSGNIGSGSSLSPEMSIDTAPAVVDIIGRGKPLATDTNASAVSFNVRFNETVTGVDSSDFELVLSGGVTVANPLFVSGSGNSYTVDVSGISKTDGMLGIRLKSDSSILDAFNNALVNRTPGENQSYTIDNTAPSVVSIVSDKTRLGATNSATITITFSEVPKGFDSFDVGATFGSISNLSATSNPRVYTATFTPSGVITSDARVTVYQGYSDAAGNPGTALTMVSPISVVAAPVGKIVPQNPPAEVTPLGNITLLVTFTEDVNNLALDDFTTTGTVTLSGLQRVSNSNRLFTVVATAGSLEGEFSVGLKANATEDSGLSDNKTAAVAPITIRVDASSSFADAKLVSVAQGTKTSASGIADNIKDADFFKFTADFTGSVSTLVKADGSKFDAFATAYVQNDDGSFKLLIADDNSGGGTTSKMDFNVTTGKTYFIKVESLAKTSGRYTVEITGGEKLADDYGDAQSDAASLVVNSTPRVINGTLENNQDKDSFKFTASQTGKASVSMAASTLASGKLEIYSNSTTVLRTVALNGSAELDVVAGQTYYLIVSSDAGDVGDYSFSISAKASLLFTTTNAVAVAKATNFLPVAGNVDVYTVVAPSTGLLSILVENKDRGIPSQPEFSVYNASGTRVATNVGAVFGPAGTSKQIINLNTTLGETYLLKIGETGTFTGSYNITAQSDDFGTVRTSPTSLTSGAAAGKIDLSGDADLFSFSYANTTANTAKLQITQTASTGSSLLPSMFVSTDNGSSWIPAINKGTLVELEVDPSTTASLLIWASGASGSTGAYNINTRAVIDDFGNTSATATTVLLDQSNISSTNGIFNYSGDQDVFKVTLNNSGTTLFSVESIDDSLFDPKLTITSLSGQVIASDNDSGKGLGSLIVLEGTLGDTFYLTVSGILNGTNGVAYTLKTGELPVDDAGNKPDTSSVQLSFNAPVVVNGKSTQVAIENKTIRAAMPGIADFDVYQFTANDTGRFEISVAPSAGSASLAANLSVLASDGKTVLASTSGIAGKNVFALPYLNKGDKVYISVSGGNSTEGDYTLKVETPVSIVDFYSNSHNDSTSGLPLGLIPIIGNTNSGSLAISDMNIEAARDVDVFTFTAKNTGPVKVLVSKTTSSTIDTSISIMDASGKVLASNNDADRETTNSAAVFEVTANSVYYISVTGNAGTTGQYGIALQDLTPTDSDGFGSDFSTATILTFDSNLGVRTDDSIISAGDRDLFELTVGSDGVLGFGLNSRESNLDGYLRIYNSDRELIAEDNDSGDGLDSFISVSASAGDVFYIQTGAVGSSVGNYRVWARLEIDDHANLIGSGATQMDVGDNFAYDFGAINSKDDIDVFSYTATTTGTIDIFLGADEGSSLDTYLFVFDSTGDILINYNNDISTTDKDSALSIQVLEGKTYYFKVSGARDSIGDYILEVSPVADDVGSSFDDATNLPLSVSNSTPANTSVASTNGAIETTGDADYYKVSISVTGRYKFKVSKDTASAAGLDDSMLEIYSHDGKLLGKNDDATSTSSDSELEINLSTDDIVYLKASGYGDKTGAYVAEVVYVGAVIVDDYGNTTDKASLFVFDDTSSYSLTGAAIQVDGDLDYFKGVADITGSINISLVSTSTLQGTVKAFVNRDGVLVQVASEKATAAGTALSLSFSVAASDEFYIQVSGGNATIGSYDLNVTNTVSTANTTSPKAVDTSVINSTADELSTQFTKAIAAAADGADINAISQNITQKLVDAFIASMGGALDQTYIILWLDPADFNFAGAGTNVGNQAGSTTNQGSSTSLSTNGALNTVIVSGAQASQYSLNMTGVGSGQVLAGATMVTAGGQIINPTVSINGSSSSGIAAADGVPKSGLNMVLDFSTPGSGGGNNGGGNNGGGNNGGNNGGGSQVGVLPGNGGSSGSSGGTSSSSSSSSSNATASGSGGGGSFASLVNAIVRTSSAITGTGATTVLANLASIAFGGGGAAATVDEKQLAKELGGDAPGEGLELNEKENKEAKLPGSSDVLKATASLVTVSIAEAYKSTDLAVFSTLQAEHQVISEVATILDKVLPILVPSEFENSVENLLVKTEQSLLQEGKETLTKVANTLADLVQARVDKNLPPVNKKADAKITTFEFVVAGLVDAAKHVQNVQDGGLNTEVLFVQELPEGFEEMLNYTAAYRNNLEDAFVSQAMIIDDESNNKLTEAVGLLAGALLAPGFLNGTHAALAPVTEKPRSKKRKS
ncbi:hypothetical protein EBX93_00535, partial [bacterium]|nr:hypothetical protein [bacterium]